METCLIAFNVRKYDFLLCADTEAEAISRRELDTDRTGIWSCGIKDNACDACIHRDCQIKARENRGRKIRRFSGNTATTGVDVCHCGVSMFGP
jgi:hypothetical protein